MWKWNSQSFTLQTVNDGLTVNDTVIIDILYNSSENEGFYLSVTGEAAAAPLKWKQ